MAVPIPLGMAPISRSMVQPIAAAELKTSAMMNKDGALRPHASTGPHFCKLKEYEIIMLIYNRKPCRLDLLSFCAPEDIIL